MTKKMRVWKIEEVSLFDAVVGSDCTVDGTLNANLLLFLTRQCREADQKPKDFKDDVQTPNPFFRQGFRKRLGKQA